MNFLALLVTTDDAAIKPLKQVLSGFGLLVQTCNHASAPARLRGQKFDAVVVDFDDPASASEVLQHAYQVSSGTNAITAALLSDRTKVRVAFGAGANFVLYKPLSLQHTEASLRAAIAIMKRERRRSLRVPAQAQVWLQVEEEGEIEAVLLCLSDNGMEVVAQRPLAPTASIGFRFNLPGGGSEITGRAEVAWANPNGQAGARFTQISDNQQAGIKKWVLSNAQLLPPDSLESISQCKLTDLSLGGCYVETQSPFPERAGIVLCMKAGNLEVQADGVVRVMHPGTGMGIELVPRAEEQQEQVHSLIDFLCSRPGESPELHVIPVAAVASDVTVRQRDYEDALLDLLRNHEAFTQNDFLRELRQQRTMSEVFS
ncbi:MAG TPA: PilZ domain-containing protein [Terriglobales bacterium]|jgi:CheY-like chemotaxis protein